MLPPATYKMLELDFTLEEIGRIANLLINFSFEGKIAVACLFSLACERGINFEDIFKACQEEWHGRHFSRITPGKKIASIEAFEKICHQLGMEIDFKKENKSEVNDQLLIITLNYGTTSIN